MTKKREKTMAITSITVDDLVNEVASKPKKLRPNFIITSEDHSGAPRVFSAGDIALGAVNQARQVQKQLGYTNVHIKMWHEATSSYVDNDKYQAQAFPEKTTKTASGDLVTVRAGKFALQQHKDLVHRVRVSGEFDTETRAELAKSFLESYKAMGGTIDELADFLTAESPDELGNMYEGNDNGEYRD